MNARVVSSKPEEFIQKFTSWAKRQRTISGVVLVGSWARGAARPDSDIDFVIVTDGPGQFLDREEWISEMGKPTRVDREDFGMVQVRRALYSDGIEVEFGITTPGWLEANPIDEGTRRVMADGYRVLDDKDRLFEQFEETSGIRAWADAAR